MKKHAASHGMAILICTISSGLLLKMGEVRYPELIKSLGDISAEINFFFGLGYTVNEISELIVAVLLSAVWGLA